MGETMERVGAVMRSHQSFLVDGIWDKLNADFFDCINNYFPELEESIRNVACASNNFYEEIHPDFGNSLKLQMMYLQLARHFTFLCYFLKTNSNFLGEDCNIELVDYYGTEALNIVSNVKRIAMGDMTLIQFNNSLKANIFEETNESVEIIFRKLDSNERLGHDELEDLLHLYCLNYYNSVCLDDL